MPPSPDQGKARAAGRRQEAGQQDDFRPQCPQRRDHFQDIHRGATNYPSRQAVSVDRSAELTFSPI